MSTTFAPPTAVVSTGAVAAPSITRRIQPGVPPQSPSTPVPVIGAAHRTPSRKPSSKKALLKEKAVTETQLEHLRELAESDSALARVLVCKTSASVCGMCFTLEKDQDALLECTSCHFKFHRKSGDRDCGESFGFFYIDGEFLDDSEDLDSLNEKWRICVEDLTDVNFRVTYGTIPKFLRKAPSQMRAMSKEYLLDRKSLEMSRMVLWKAYARKLLHRKSR